MLRLLTLIFLIWSSLTLAQSNGIAIGYQNNPAVDLMRDGQILTVNALDKEISDKKLDISLINPSTKSDLWKDTFPEKLPEDNNPLVDMSEVNYHSPVASESGIFRFNVLNKSGDNRLYTFMLSKTVHSILLAKTLLRKIGYTIPNVKYLPRVVLKFKDENQIKAFKFYLEETAMAGSPSSWIVEELSDNRLLLQDLVVMDSTNEIYNLAVGVTPDMIQGRRLMSALAIPFTMVNLLESVNMLRWNTGFNTVLGGKKVVVLFHDRLDNFQCTWEDARWISRRIARLKEDDWKEVVESSHLPGSVQQILLEKFKARRNSTMKLFNIDVIDLPVNPKQNNGTELVDGKLISEVEVGADGDLVTKRWPGYASRFSYGDPESPLSDTDIRSWIKSRAISTALDSAVSQLNQLPFMGTQVLSQNEAKFKEELAKAAQQSVLNHTPSEIPLKAWTFPTIRGQLILSRNLVTGTYLGTDNLVQLVDTVGVAIGGGVFAGAMGVGYQTAAKYVPISVYVQSEAMLMRTYSHLRPITNIQRSLEYPYKNIFVPLVKMDFGQKLYEASNTVLDSSLSDREKKEKVEAVLKPFKDMISIGESMIVTDTINTYAGGVASVNIYQKLLSISLGIVPGHQVISRFHVHRRSEHEFHIYKDIGHKGSVNISFNINSLIPIVDTNAKKDGGHARVKFYSLNLNPANPEALKNAGSLRRAILNSSTKEMEDSGNKPIVVKHTYRESTPQLGLLWWQWIRQNSSTNITITEPDGEETYLKRHYWGSTHGRNYQTYVNSMITLWVNLLFKKRAGLTDSTGTNPGYSFKGKATNKILTLDQQVEKDGTLIEPFIRLTRSQNGWSIDRQRAEKILKEMQDRYDFSFYSPFLLNETYKIYLYNIAVTMVFYQAGIEHLLSMKEQDIRDIFKSAMVQKTGLVPIQIEEHETGVNRFLRLLKRYRKFVAKHNEEKANKNLLKAFSHMENKLTLKGIVRLMGAEENMYMASRIDGFREGDEAGDKPLFSNSLGGFGSERTLGPVTQKQIDTRMLEGEFFIYWLMTRLL